MKVFGAAVGSTAESLEGEMMRDKADIADVKGSSKVVDVAVFDRN